MLFPKLSDQFFETKTIQRHQLPEASHEEVPAGAGDRERRVSSGDACNPVDREGTSGTSRHDCPHWLQGRLCDGCS